jgi:MFS family permease
LLTPVLPLYILSLGFSIEGWGTFVMVYAASTFIFEWIWGVLADLTDRRIFISAGLVSGAFFIFLFTNKSLLPFFFILQFLRGVFRIMVGPAVKALVFDMNYSRSIGLSMGVFTAVRSLGGVLGPVLGSSIVYFWGYKEALYTYSLLSIAGAVVMLAVKVDRERRQPQKLDFSEFLRDWRFLFATRTIAVMFMVAVILFFAHTAINSYVPIYAQEVVGMTMIEIGTLFSVGSIVGLFTTPLFGWMSDRFGRSRIILSSFILSTVLMTGFTFAKSPFLMGLAMVLFMVVFTPLTPMALAMLTDVTPRRLMGTSLGLYSTFENLGMIFTPPILSIAWSYTPEAMFAAIALTQTIGILLLLPSRKLFK